MPLNEAVIPKFGRGLTTKQKREQLASLYGLPIIDLPSEEVSRLRKLLALQPPDERDFNDDASDYQY